MIRLTLTNINSGELGLFRDDHDIALSLSLDGVQLTNMKNHEIWPVVLFNLNLPPNERTKMKNILTSIIIPGPKSPGDLDSFLHPLVEEMHELERGIEGTDGDDERSFILRAWISMVTG